MTGRHLKVSKTKVDWCTPEPILEIVRETFGGTIDLDPCSNESSIVGARENWISPEKDALRDLWSGNVYVNPPYSREHNLNFSLAWVRNTLETEAQIALVPAATGTAWFRNYAQFSTCVAFVGRVRFIGAEAVTPFDLALVYYGGHKKTFERALFNSEYAASLVMSTDP